jgi:hypothetical protein
MSAPPTTQTEDWLRALILSKRKPLRLSARDLAEMIANSGDAESVVHELVGLLIDHDHPFNADRPF